MNETSRPLPRAPRPRPVVRNRTIRECLLATAGLMACAMLPGTAAGQSSWNGTDGSWFDAAGWDTAAVPAGGVITIGNGGTVRIQDALVNGIASGGGLLLGTSGAATGSGTLILENGGQLQTTGGAILGQNGTGGPATRRGEVILDGSGTKWTNSGGTLSIGHSSVTGAVGSGAIVIRNGAVLEQSGSATTLGGPDLSGSGLTQGSLTVTGAGSLFTTNSTITLGNSGQSTLTVANGGVLAMTGANRILNLGDRSNFSVAVNIGGARGEAATGAGVLDVAEITSNPLSTFATRFVAFNHTESDYFFTSDGTASGTAIKISGRNAVEVASGTTTLVGSQTYLQATTVNNGTLKLAGGGSISNSPAFWIGNNAGDDGKMIVESGAKVGSSGGYQITLLGNGAGASGTATIRGAGAEWWAGRTSIGNGGTGSLNVEAGAAVYGNTSASLGYDAQSNGTATITGGGSKWQISGLDKGIDVGLGGKGSLTVENGATVSSGYGIVGNYAGSEGSATIKGSGSQWSLGGAFFIGNSGKGTLDLEAGGKLSVFGSSQGGVTLGKWQTGDGTIRVSGANSRLEWSYNDLIVGAAGKGTLEISNGGTVVYTGVSPFTESEIHVATEAGSTGVIKLNGTEAGQGVLEVRQVVKGAGNGSIEFDGGILKARYVEEDFLSNFSTGDVKLKSGGGTIDTNGREVHVQAGLTGVGGFRKAGQGTLVLNGENDYAGPTEVLQGKLVVNGGMASSVSVTSGASLGGNGTFAGNVDVAAGANIAPGNSAGTMHFTGDLTLDAAAVYTWELGSLGTHSGVDSDLLSISGSGKTMTFGEGSSLVLNFVTGVLGPDSDEQGFWLTNHEWLIASATGGATLVNGGLTLADPAPYENGIFTIVDRGNQIFLSYTTVPEPSSLILSLAGAGLVLRRRRPRQRNFPHPE